MPKRKSLNAESLNKGETIRPGTRRRKTFNYLVLMFIPVLVIFFAVIILAINDYGSGLSVPARFIFIALLVCVFVALLMSGFRNGKERIEAELGIEFTGYKTKLDYSVATYGNKRYQQYTRYYIKDPTFDTFIASRGWEHLPPAGEDLEIINAFAEKDVYINKRKVWFGSLQSGYYKIVDLDAADNKSLPIAQREHIKLAIGVYDTDEKIFFFLHYE